MAEGLRLTCSAMGINPANNKGGSCYTNLDKRVCVLVTYSSVCFCVFVVFLIFYSLVFFYVFLCVFIFLMIYFLVQLIIWLLLHEL